MVLSCRFNEVLMLLPHILCPRAFWVIRLFIVVDNYAQQQSIGYLHFPNKAVLSEQLALCCSMYLECQHVNRPAFFAADV